MNIEKEKIGKLIEQIKHGDKEAFEELYKLTSPKVYFVALKIVCNEQDAEDILQETYIKVLEKIDEIDPSQSFMGWLYRVVSNKSKNHLKKKNAVLFDACEEEEFDDIPDDRVDFNPEESLDRNEACREVMTAIDELSDEKRICIIMKYFGEMTVNEIAESLEVPESTVRNRVFVAKKELKGKFENKSSTLFCNAAPVAIVVWALNRTAETISADFAASAMSAAILSGVSASSATAAITATTASASTAVSAGTGVATKVAALSATQKVVAGVAAVSIIGSSAASVVTVVKNNNTHDRETLTNIEAVTTAPSQAAEYVFEFISEVAESKTETESTVIEKQTVPNISTSKLLTTMQSSKEPETTQRETTTQKITTTKQETTTQAESTTKSETTTQPSTTETTVQQIATLKIDVTDMDDNVVDTLILSVDAGTEMTWDYLITLISQNGYEAMAGVYGDGVGAVAQAGETYIFTAEL